MVAIEFSNGVTISAKVDTIRWPKAFEEIGDSKLLSAYAILSVSNPTENAVKIKVYSTLLEDNELIKDGQSVQEETVESNTETGPEETDAIHVETRLEIKSGSHYVVHNVNCEIDGENKRVATQGTEYFGG